MWCVQVDSTAGSITESLQARVSQNPEHAQLLSEHRRMEKGRKELENQVPKHACLASPSPPPGPLLTAIYCDVALNRRCVRAGTTLLSSSAL